MLSHPPAPDLIAAEVDSGRLPETTGQFTIVFEPGGEGAHLVLRWEDTQVRVSMEAAAGTR